MNAVLLFLRGRWKPVSGAVLLLALSSAWAFGRNRTSADSSVIARVKRGEFKVVVTTSGELRARKFVQMNVPQNAQQAGVYQMKIASIVPEGTPVKEGDVVAEIDRSMISTAMADINLALQKAQAQNEQANLDSTLNLSTARESMHTMELALEEKKLAKEGAVYEAPTIRRQTEIDYEKAERALAQARSDYVTKTEQAKAKMREVGTDLTRQQNRLKIAQEVMAGFTVRAPAPGMVIYVKEWNGKKRTTGSQVSSWDPGVATLPDLTQMESVTYVNEIDVRKIAVGQPVVLTLDSDPSKKLTGKVTGVANVGEQRPNTDAKVFEVKVVVEGADTTLRPGMTTGNAIETAKSDNVLFVPIEAVNGEGSVPYVYKMAGSRVSKQEVVVGTMNENEVVIANGLAEDDRVLLTIPDGHEKMDLVRLPGTGGLPAVAGGDTALKRSLAPPRNDSTPKAAPPAPGKTRPLPARE